MKKYIVILVLSFLSFLVKVSASDEFYLGEKIQGMYYIMDKNGTKVFANFKKIHRKDTNELVFCIEPGIRVSDYEYTGYISYNEKLNINQEQMDKVKLIAKYGYLYGNHTDIKWYSITQYMIWKVVMPSSWDVYFVDQYKNRLDNVYDDEISEINYLINNHKNNPKIESSYTFNYKEDIIIFDENRLVNNYIVSNGYIDNNKIFLGNNLKPGDHSYNLHINGYRLPYFYVHPNGQNLFQKGEVYQNNINFNIHITAGKIKINECNEYTFKDEIIGGEYEVLNIDNEVEEIIDCKDNNEECLSKILPIGSYKIRVKSAGENFIENDHIYDVEVRDNETSKISVCSIPNPQRREVALEEEKDEEIEETQENEEEIIFNNEEVKDNEDEFNEIDIPNTSKDSYMIEYLFLINTPIIIVSYVKRKHESIK